jgi:sugar lactone lactonase YvrE
MTTKLVLAAEDIVGESIVWDDRRNRLVWVDIIGRRIHGFFPGTGVHVVWNVAGRPTSIGLRHDGGAIVGMERHVCLWDWEGEPLQVCEVEPSQPGNRLNEGVVGPDSCFWIGTMQNNIADDDSPLDVVQPVGRLYRFAPDGTLSRISDDAFGITNTFVWPQDNLLITADTLANELYSYRIGADGALSDRKTIQAGFERGLPDGSAVDVEGFVWTARVAGGACLTRTSPDGRIDRVVDLPCTWPTSCTFGGPDLATLFVTSARFTMSAGHLQANPKEGALFAVDVGVKGHAAHRFG